MTRGDRLAALIERVRPFDAWRKCRESDSWALVTVAGDRDDNGVAWVRTFSTRDAVDRYVRDELTGDERAELLVDLDTGCEYVLVVAWVRNQCRWPTCDRQPAPNGRQFLDGVLCSEHTAESYELDARARDEIAAEREAARA